MQVTKGNTAAGTVTTRPEELTDKLIQYRTCLAILRGMDLSPATYRRCASKLGIRLGFNKTSIFSEIA